MTRRTKSYGLNNPLQDVFPEPIRAQRAPTANDRNYEIGQNWIDSSTDEVYVLTSITAGTPTWSDLGPGASDVDTLTGDTGGAISPALGNINIVGGTGYTVAGAGNTLTINQDTGGAPISKYIVAADGSADYTTIQAALDAANAEVISGAVSAAAVYVRPGVYTENLTCYDRVELLSTQAQCDSYITEIVGTHTPPLTGYSAWYGFTLTGDTAIWRSNAAGTAILGQWNIITRLLNNGYTYDIPNWAGELNLWGFLDDISAGVSNGFVNNQFGSAEVNMIFAGVSLIPNTGTMLVNGSIVVQAMLIGPKIRLLGNATGIGNTGTEFLNTIELRDNSSFDLSGCYFFTAAEEAINTTSTGTCTMSNCSINSSASPVINGTGTVDITGGAFVDSDTIAATITLQGGSQLSATFNTTNQATGLTITDNTILADGTTANIDINLTPKGTGDLVLDNGAYTVGAGDDLNINSIAGQDIIMKMGDNAAANKISFTDSGDVEVASLDSNATLTVVNMDGIIGATTPAAITGTTIIANTSVTSPIYTTGAAADMNINSATGQDIIIQMGDNAGANKVSFEDSDSAEVFSIDSNGAIGTVTGLTVAGAFAQTAGTFNVGQDNAANAINIGGGTTARAIGLGNSAAAHTITIGDAAAGAIAIDTAAGFSIDGATASNITVTSAGLDLSLEGVGCAVRMTSTEAQNDAIYIEASAANGGVEIQAGTGGIRMGDTVDCLGITLGNIAPTAGRTIVIGSGTVVTAAVTDDISIGDGGATTNANSIKHVDINNGGVTLGEVNTYIANGAVTSGTHLTEIATGNRAAGTATLNMSTGTGTKTVNIGNADGATTINIDAITAINTDVNAAVTINTGTSTGAITLGAIANSGAVAIESSSTIDVDAAGAISLNSTGAAINIGDDANAFAINIGSGAAARTVTLGNITGASSVIVDVGTGAASFGASATAHTTTIGSTTGASATVIQAGTGEITMTGTVKQIDAELMGQSGIYIPTINQDAVAASGANTGGVPTGATGNINLYALQGGFVMQGFVVGAGQTILQPIMGANGLIISADQTNTEGMEYNFPYFSYTIGTSAAFAFELDLYINDMDGADPYVFGFRKNDANNADWTAYDTLVSMGMDAATSTTNVILATELNGGGQTLTNTTDAWGGDGSTNTLRVLVDASGNVTYTINGVAPSVTAAIQFDNADVVIPFIRIGHNANATDVAITGMRIGFQA